VKKLPQLKCPTEFFLIFVPSLKLDSKFALLAAPHAEVILSDIHL